MFCFQPNMFRRNFITAGIKFKIPKHNFKENVETFYNVGSEKNWIKSALYEKEYNSVLAHWVDVKKPEFLNEECDKNLTENGNSDTESVTKEITFFEKCKKVLKVCNVKLATKSETLQKCDDFVEECQTKMGRKFKNVRKMLLDVFSNLRSRKYCPPVGKKELRSNNSSRFSQNLFLWLILNILLHTYLYLIIA